MLACLSRKQSTAVSAFVRRLNLYEYQTKTILADHGCTVQRFCVLEQDRYEALCAMNAIRYVVKAQIECGDRGRGIFTSGFRGGVHLAYSHRESIEIAQRMLGELLVTNETGAEGAHVHKVLVAEDVIALQTRGLFFTMCDTHGPSIHITDVHQINQKCGELSDSSKVACGWHISVEDKLPEIVVHTVADALNFGNVFRPKVESHVRSLWSVFNKYHALYLAVNPMVLSNAGDIVCLEAKMIIDDNALTIPAVAPLFDDNNIETQRNALKKLDFVKLGGNIGCLVDGVGMALAINDLVTSYGGCPANYCHLNVMTKSAIEANNENLQIGLNALMAIKKITSILIILSWHSDCTQIAKILIEMKCPRPIVLRLKGMNDEAAWKLLEASGLKIYKVSDMEEAARKVIALSDVSEKLKRNK